MKLSTMMAALVAAVACLAANAFVMPTGVPSGAALSRAGQALGPATAQPAPSRSNGKPSQSPPAPVSWCLASLASAVHGQSVWLSVWLIECFVGLCVSGVGVSVFAYMSDYGL